MRVKKDFSPPFPSTSLELLLYMCKCIVACICIRNLAPNNLRTVKRREDNRTKKTGVETVEKQV